MKMLMVFWDPKQSVVGVVMVVLRLVVMAIAATTAIGLTTVF